MLDCRKPLHGPRNLGKGGWSERGHARVVGWNLGS